MAKENREIKSGVFADLFGDDEKDGKRNFLSLYNALHGTDLKLENTVIEAKKIPQAVIKTFYNDVSMLINGKLIVLVEHQSTPNQNMPLRGLFYFTQLYHKYLKDTDKQLTNSTLIKIPNPNYIVFYNGDTTRDEDYELKLSDALNASDTPS